MGYTLLDESGAPVKGTYTLLPDEPKPSKPFGQQLNDAVSDLPRQLGLTARYGLEGVGGMADMVTAPIRAGLNLIPGVNVKPGIGQAAAGMLGLPEPRTADERVVGDATRMLAGGLVPIGAGAALARGGSGVAQRVGQMLATNPAQQLASAGAAGAAGGYTRETGGDDTSQMLASLGAGIATPFAMNGISRGAQSAAGAMQRMIAPRAIPPVQIDVTINNALQQSGFDLSSMAPDVAAGMRADVAKAMQTGGNLNPDAIRRLADYRLTGATPTHGSLVRTPAAFTQQKNLAKLGVNSKDEAAQTLANVEFSNNATLIKTVNGVGASTADDAYAGGEKIIGGVQAYDDRATGIIGKLYAKARATNGRAALLDHEAFIVKANGLLDDALLGGKLPADVRNILMRDFQKVVKNPITQLDANGNPIPKDAFGLPVDVAEQIKTRIGDLQRATIDGGEKKALGLVRQALDDTPLQPGQEIGRESITAFNRARRLNRQYMGAVEKTPALEAVRDGIEPDAFVQKFIVGGGKAQAMDVAMLKNSIKGDPVAMDAVKEQIALHLKNRALTGKSDEVGRFSESAFNRAYDAIGDRKMRLFFSVGEINQMKAAGRVASYEQVQPVGSAVNNSNTASTGGAMLLDRFANSPLLSKLPGGRLLAEPAQNISIGMRATKTLDAPYALTDGTRTRLPIPPRGLLLSPAALMGTETEDERRRREAGLLFP